jgi:nicotinate-nucleotide--dimethylbenzimidazole phosphoribosyltransferase
VIDRALALHQLAHGDALAALRCVGGFEIAALAGAYIACAQSGLPVLVDGFITTAAALAACRMNPGVRDWLLFAHASAEPGHARLLTALAARPLLQLDMRLGEGSGAATALPIAASGLRAACRHGDLCRSRRASGRNPNDPRRHLGDRSAAWPGGWPTFRLSRRAR